MTDRRCKDCGRRPTETHFYGGSHAKDGLRARCAECMRVGGKPGPSAVPVWDRLTESPDGCWLWEGSHAGTGYGYIRHEGKHKLVHRLVYEELVTEIPDGLELDHLCLTKNCANPDHLEVVDRHTNMQRAFSVKRYSGVCPHCGKKFEAARRDQKWCSQTCGKAAWKRRKKNAN